LPKSPRGIAILFSALGAIWLAGVIIQGYLKANAKSLIIFDFGLSGSFGDSFGGLSAFMATLAAIGAWQAVILQRNEIADRGKETTIAQNLTKKQAFESTFFSMVSYFGSIVESTEIVPVHYNFRSLSKGGSILEQGVPQTGKSAYEHLAIKLERKISEKEGESASEIWSIFYENSKGDLGHYFRVLYNIFLFIDESSVYSKWDYSRFLRAQLSNSELILLAFNCAYGYGDPKFLRLLIKYSLLDNLDLKAEKEIEAEILSLLKSRISDRAFNSELAKQEDPQLFGIDF
jgi:hypothetical protein